MNQVRVFQMFDPVANHNKFWRIEWEALPSGEVQYQTIYGRVGDSGRSSELAKCSERQLLALIRSKEAKGYQELKLHQPDPAAASSKGMSSEVERFWEWVHYESSAYINRYLAVSVGTLSQEQIAEGRQLLQLAQNAPDGTTKGDLIRRYYNVIPTRLPRKIDLDDLIAKFAADEQEDRLLQLEASIANNHAAINLGVELCLLDKQSDDYRRLADYVNSTAIHGYRIAVRDIFAVTIPDERRTYEQNRYGSAYKELLFHGTRNQNVRHILRTGLIVPQMASHGRMFGSGIYFANKASKSANYCAASKTEIPRMLFIAEVALGKVYTAPTAHGYNAPPRGYDSVLGKGGHTKFSILANHTLQNDEFIVYRPPQQTIRYVVTFGVCQLAQPVIRAWCPLAQLATLV